MRFYLDSCCEAQLMQYEMYARKSVSPYMYFEKLTNFNCSEKSLNRVKVSDQLTSLTSLLPGGGGGGGYFGVKRQIVQYARVNLSPDMVYYAQKILTEYRSRVSTIALSEIV